MPNSSFFENKVNLFLCSSLTPTLFKKSNVLVDNQKEKDYLGTANTQHSKQTRQRCLCSHWKKTPYKVCTHSSVSQKGVQSTKARKTEFRILLIIPALVWIIFKKMEWFFGTLIFDQLSNYSQIFQVFSFNNKIRSLRLLTSWWIMEIFQIWRMPVSKGLPK